MSQSQAVTGMSTKFERSDGAGGWTKLAEVYNIAGPGMTRETVEVTSYDSPDGYREKIAGLRDAGTLTFTMNFRKDNYTVVKSDFDSDERVQYRVVLPDEDETTMTFWGLVTELPLTVPEGDRITCDVTIEISGPVEIEEAT